MVYQFVVTLKNKNGKQIDRFSVLVLFISLLIFIRQQFIPGQMKLPVIFVCVLLAALLGYNIYQSKKGKPVFYNGALLVAAIAWIVMPFLNWLFVPFALMGLVERLAKKPLEVGFTDQEVLINSFIRRRYTWKDFNNIVLKDDLLTLDFTNNRLFQRETVDEEGDAEEDEFNAYCREQLRKSVVLSR
ncbi:MAG: hypothetical protein KGO82_09035 [Bacteroidota bacterium]|nr:hypothetical protein [Bacteroidota bacterium]